MDNDSSQRRLGSGVLAAVAVVIAFALGVGVYFVANDDSSGAGATTAPQSSVPSAGSASGSASASSTPRATTASAVLGALSADGSPEAAAVRAALGALVFDQSLGAAPGFSVVDVASGQSLVDIDSGGARTPASTTKLLTAAAALEVLGADTHFTTKVVATGSGDLVLVGGGDPTLSQRTTSDEDWPYAVTPLADLATGTAAALRLQGVTTARLAYAADLFTGPTVSPDWPSGYVSSGQVGPITALSLDGSRRTPGMAARVTDPPAYAAQQFAALLIGAGIPVTVTGAVPTPPAGADTLAEVTSPPVSDLVSQMLLRSDNDVAETLARHVAIEVGQSASFAGVQPAISGVLASLGIRADDLVLADGSGLSRENRVMPATLTDTLLAAADPDRDELRALLTGLPVAGFTGTLRVRFDNQAGAIGAGDIRAKTGYLSGVVALAGYVRDKRDQLMVFAFVADGVPDGSALDAQQVMDDLAIRLASCGCP